MSFITRQDQINDLNIQNLGITAQNLILNQPKLIEEREKSRIDYASECILDLIDPTSKVVHVEAIGLALLDLIGTGGHNGLGRNYGGASERGPVFNSCGTGRRNAHDGPAWDQAIMAAIEKVGAEFLGVQHVTFSVDLIDRDDNGNGKGVPALCMQEKYNHESPWVLFYLDDEEGFKVIQDNNMLVQTRALLGQILIALTRDQRFIGLIDDDSSYDSSMGHNVTHSGLKLDDSLFTEEGIKIIGQAFEFYNSKI